MKCKCVFPQQEVGTRNNMYINVCGGYDSLGEARRFSHLWIFASAVLLTVHRPPSWLIPLCSLEPIKGLEMMERCSRISSNSWLTFTPHLWNPLMPIFVSLTLALSWYSFLPVETDLCPNIWWELWPLVSPCIFFLYSGFPVAIWMDKYNFNFVIGWTVIEFTCDVRNSKTRNGNNFLVKAPQNICRSRSSLCEEGRQECKDTCRWWFWKSLLKK